MSVRMIILLGIFVWAPMMAYLGWKYIQTFSQQARAGKRRTRRPMIEDAAYAIPDDSRRRIYRRG